MGVDVALGVVLKVGWSCALSGREELEVGRGRRVVALCSCLGCCWSFGALDRSSDLKLEELLLRSGGCQLAGFQPG